MITRDYLMRMIDQLVKVLVRVLQHKKAHEFRLARKELETAYRSMLGVNPDFVRRFSAEQLANLIGADPDTRSTRCYVLGVLLKEEAEIERLDHHDEESLRVCLKALSLLLAAFIESPFPLESDHAKRIEECVTFLQDVHMTRDVLEPLMLFYERVGKFAKAEDILFELIDISDEYKDRGLVFYERLLQHPDAALEAGGLPRSAVLEGLSLLKR